MIVLSHSGKQHSYHTAQSIYNLNALDTFYTSSFITNSFLQNRIEKSGNTYWNRRYIKGLPGRKVNANWRFEIPEIVWRKLEGKSKRVQQLVYLRDCKFDHYVAKRLHKHVNNSNVFWGFQGSCYESLKSANSLGITSFCELATAHVAAAKRILGEEAKLHPEWANTIDNLVFPKEYEKRLEEEPHVAKKVIAASKFTQSTLFEIGINKRNILYMPLGFDHRLIPYDVNRYNPIEKRPLKLLYVGTVTQRKGIKYLLEAMRVLDSRAIELHIIGGIHGDNSALKEYSDLFYYHAPVSQQELFNRYADYDVLLLPSVFEGFGLVVVEAMAAGLPVITTTHTMGPDVIINKKNGYIVPIRDIAAIVKAVESIRQLNDNEFQAMRLEARRAALNYSWTSYQKRLQPIIKRYIDC